jgi:hypothetical protein
MKIYFIFYIFFKFVFIIDLIVCYFIKLLIILEFFFFYYISYKKNRYLRLQIYQLKLISNEDHKNNFFLKLIICVIITKNEAQQI